MPTNLPYNSGPNTGGTGPGSASAAAAVQAADMARYFPSAAPAAPAPTLADRYAPTPSRATTVEENLNAQGSAFKAAVNEANMQAGLLPGIREQQRAAAQSTVNAIKSQFDKYINEDTEAKKKLETKAYLSALAGGRAGSPTGAAESSAASEKGQEKVRKDISDRDNLINQAYADADLRASQEYERRRAEFIAGEKDQAAAEATVRANEKNAASDELSRAAAARSYDDFAKEAGPTRIQQYIKDLGLSGEPALKDFFLSKKPESSKVFSQKVGDNWVTGYKDPLTGKIQVETIALPKDPGDWKFQNIDGIGYFVNTTTQEIRPATGGAGGTIGKQVSGAPKGFTEGDIEQGRDMFKRFGKNGYATPAFYIDAYQTWVNKGGTPSKFLAIYPPDEFVDPNDIELMPTWLRPKAVKPPATTPTSNASSASSTTAGTGRSF